MSIVIIGAGIIGVSTAYQLQELGCKDEIHLVESCPELFSGASGYAAGFVASNWYSASMLPLGALSFSLHKSIAKERDGSERWGYSGSTGISLGQSLDGDDAEAEALEGAEDWLLQGTSRAQVAQRNEQYGKSNDDRPRWLRVGKSQSCEVISGVDSTAQVDPHRMCQCLLSIIQKRGGHVHSGCTAEQLVKNTEGHLSGLQLSTRETIACTKLVFTAGSWTPQAFEKLFPKSKRAQQKINDIGKLAGHSIIIKSPHWKAAAEEEGRSFLGCHAVFATTFSSSKSIVGSKSFAPEIFSRLPDEIYVAGLNSSSAPLPDRADLSVINEDDVEALKEVARKIIKLSDKETADLEIVRKGHCFRPTTSSGRPFISEVSTKWLTDDSTFDEEGGVWLSAGHGPWGISLSQGTGKVLAELVMRVKPSIDVKPFKL